MHGSRTRSAGVVRPALAVVLAATSLTPAQAPPATAGATAPSGTPSTQPGTQPGTRPTTAPATGPAARISLNFKDTPIDAVLDYLSENAGFVVVKEAPVDGRVTVISKQPVTPDEAVAMVGSVLKATGHTATLSGRVLRVAAREKAKKGAIPVHVGVDPEQIPATDELITQIMPLANVEAVKLRQDLQPLLPPEADVAAHEASNAIVMTDAAANIRRVAQIVSALDRREASGTALKMIPLRNAAAAATAKVLMSVFKPDGGGPVDPRVAAMQAQMQQQQQQQGGAAAGAGKGGRVPGSAVDQALRGGRVNVVAEERTNTLLVTAPTEAMPVVEQVIRELDANPTPASEMRAFPLKFAAAEPTAKLLQTLVKGDGGSNPMMDYYFGRFGMSADAGGGPKVNITHDDRTNSVIVSAPAEVLKNVEGLVKQLDSNPVSSAEMRVFQLKHADAFLASLLVEDTFSPREKDGGSTRFPAYIFGMGGQQPAAKGPRVTATSDDRTNTLVVTAPSELMKSIEELVQRIDSNPASEEALFIYRLRNGQAANLEFVLNTLFGNYDQGGQQNGNDPRQNPEARQQMVADDGSGLGGRGGGGGRAGGGTGGGRRRTGRADRYGGGGGGRQGNMPNVPAGIARATNELSGEVFVVADRDTNSLIVTTATKYRDRVQKIIEDLDRPTQQVLIKVLVAEVTHDNSSDVGVDFSILNRRPGGEGQSIGTNFGTAAAALNPNVTGGLVVQLLESNVTATLRLLATQGKLDVLSRPYILASDNQLAAITVGQEVPFITNTRLTETGQTINTIQYQDVGIILNVTPHINPDGLVILDVVPEISQITGTTVPIGENVSAPVIAKRSAESRVGIKNGQTIVIGGLMEDRKTSTVNKVPVLGDLPVLGPLFSRSQVSKTKTELLIFLTPHVAPVPDALPAMSADEQEGTRLAPRAVEPGMWQDHLRGLRRGATQPTQPATDVGEGR